MLFFCSAVSDQCYLLFQMWFVWPYTMRNRDANSASEQTMRMKDRRPTQTLQAEPQTEIRDLQSRCNSHVNMSNTSSPSPQSPSVRISPIIS